MASKFKTKVVKDFEKQGWTVICVIRLSDNGYPDLILMRKGVTMWIEIKEDGDTLKPLQKLRIDQLKQNGFEAYCLHATKGRIYG